MSMQELLTEIRALSIEERKELMKYLVDTITEPPLSAKKKRSLREYRGVGAHLYDGTDAQAHVNELRREWDDRA